jgi:hypothetical protein
VTDRTNRLVAAEVLAPLLERCNVLRCWVTGNYRTLPSGAGSCWGAHALDLTRRRDLAIRARQDSPFSDGVLDNGLKRSVPLPGDCGYLRRG